MDAENITFREYLKGKNTTDGDIPMRKCTRCLESKPRDGNYYHHRTKKTTKLQYPAYCKSCFASYHKSRRNK